MLSPRPRNTVAGLAAVVLLAACTDRTPTQSAPPAGEEVRTQISCIADVPAGQVLCGRPGAAGGPAASIILGGQDVYVRLESSGVRYDSAAQVFSLDVTLYNVLAQQLGTPDGTAVSGAQVFFEQEPVATVGAGQITIANADGQGTYTRAAQPYFDYPEILEPLGSSQPRTWRFGVPSTVERFAFTVYVRTELPVEQGVLRWIQEEGTASSPTTHVWSLWGTPAGELFGVGAIGRILHFDGRRWTPMPSGVTATLLGVWGNSRREIYAVGDSGTVLRYDGNRWNRLTVSVPGRLLRGVRAHGDTVWIAGAERVSPTQTQGLILRSVDRGQSWTETFSPPGTGTRSLGGITRTDDGTLVVVGQETGTSRGVDEGVILRSTDGGQTWAESLTSEPTSRRLNRVWSYATHVFAVGSDDTGTQGFTMRSTDGGVTWTRMMHAGVGTLFGVWGWGPDDVTVVGANGAILHFDGTTWSDVRPEGPGRDLYTVWGTTDGDVIAAGHDQAVARRSGGLWVQAPAIGETDYVYTAAWGAAPGDLYVLTRIYNDVTNQWGSAVRRRTNGTWSTVRPREEDLTLEGIWGTSHENIVVAGYRVVRPFNQPAYYQSAILRWDGTTWTETATRHRGRRLYGVHGDGTGNMWIAGNHQDSVTNRLDVLMMRSRDDGRAWDAPVLLPVPQHTPQLFSVWTSGPSNVHAVGVAFRASNTYGLRVRFDGTTWHTTLETEPSELATVYGTSDGTLYAGGTQGQYNSRSQLGLILTSSDNGISWQRSTFASVVGTRRAIDAFWSASPDVVYAAGTGGPLLQKDGARWEATGPVGATINTLWGFSPTDVWALGGDGSVIHGIR